MGERRGRMLDDEGFRDLGYLDLEELTISRICVGKVPTKLFFNLRYLSVSDLKELVELLPVKPLPQKLTTLKISSCQHLTYIFSENGSSPSSNEDDRVNKESDIIELPQLKELHIYDTTNLISVVKSTSTHDSGHTSLFNNKVKLPSLEELILNEVGSFVKVWGKESCQHSFQNLKLLRIERCEIETLGPPSILISLVQLETLHVTYCFKMQHIISKECERHEIPEEIIAFPKLKHLKFFALENLESFYSGSYKIKFPRLETLKLGSLGSATMFPGHGSSRDFFHEKMEFPSLEELDVSFLSDKVSVLWDFPDIMAEREDEGIASNPLPKLETLRLEQFFAPKLRSLTVAYNNELQWLFSGEPNQIVELPSLEKVGIDRCKAMKSLSTIPLKAPKLKELTVSNCPEMEWFLLGNTHCGAVPELTLPSLQNVIINSSPNIKSFSPAVLKAPKLDRVYVDDRDIYREYRIPKSEDINQCLQIPARKYIFLD